MKSGLQWVSAIALALAVSTPGSRVLAQSSGSVALPERIPTERFADRDVFSQATLSPDGKRIAFHAAAENQSALTVLDADTRKKLASMAWTSDVGYNWHRWAGPDIVLISVGQMTTLFGEEVRVTRLMALDVRTNKRWVVGPKKMGVEGDDLLHVAPDGSSVLLSFQRSVFDWPGVTRVSLLNPEDQGFDLQRPVDGIWEWFADDVGVVRMGMGATGGKVNIVYRKDGVERFRSIAKIGKDETDKIFDVNRIISGSDEAYVIEAEDDGRKVLKRYDLAARKPIETVFRNDDWDVTGALLDRAGKPLAVEFTDDRDRRKWLDPDAAKLQIKMEKATKAEEVWIVSRSEDGSRMLVYAGGESDPGMLYLYKAADKTLDIVAAFRPDLPVANLAKPKPVSYTARDGTKIASYLTLPRGIEAKSLPLIVMPHGGPYGVRDKLQYNDEVQLLANRGYAVLQPNYRGSGGYGDHFYKLGEGQIGRAMQDDIDDAMDWAVKEGIADANRVCVVGASYGGYAAMWAAIRNPERYRCAASFAGVGDWKKMLKYDARFLSRKGAKDWRGKVAGTGDFDLDQVAPARSIAKLKVPLLVAHGRKDSNVPFTQFKQIEDAARGTGVPLETMIFDEAGHGFDSAKDEARWFTALEAFLTKHNPAG